MSWNYSYDPNAQGFGGSGYSPRPTAPPDGWPPGYNPNATNAPAATGWPPATPPPTNPGGYNTSSSPYNSSPYNTNPYTGTDNSNAWPPGYSLQSTNNPAPASGWPPATPPPTTSTYSPVQSNNPSASWNNTPTSTSTHDMGGPWPPGYDPATGTFAPKPAPSVVQPTPVVTTTYYNTTPAAAWPPAATPVVVSTPTVVVQTPVVSPVYSAVPVATTATWQSGGAASVAPVYAGTTAVAPTGARTMSVMQERLLAQMAQPQVQITPPQPQPQPVVQVQPQIRSTVSQPHLQPQIQPQAHPQLRPTTSSPQLGNAASMPDSRLSGHDAPSISSKPSQYNLPIDLSQAARTSAILSHEELSTQLDQLRLLEEKEQELRAQSQRTEAQQQRNAQLQAQADKLASENVAKRKELERKRTRLIEQEQLLQTQQKIAMEEQRRREEFRRLQEKEDRDLAQQQALIEKRERELEAKKKETEEQQKRLQQALADQKAAQYQENRILEQQRLQREAERQKAEEEVRVKEQKKLQDSFYSALVDTAKLVAQNCNRLQTLLDTQFEGILEAGSTTRQFFNDVAKILDRTTARLMSMLEDNILNIEDAIHGDIAKAAATLRAAVQALITVAEKLTAAPKPGETTVSKEERTRTIRHHTVAANFAIKSLLEEMEQLKLSESSQPKAQQSAMTAGSLNEAAAIADRKLAQQGQRHEVEEQIQSRRRASASKLANFPRITMTTQQLRAYDVNKVKKVQKFARSWILRTRFRQLASDYRTAQASTESRHRVKALFEIASSEKSYLASVETALKFFLKPMTENSLGRDPCVTGPQISTMFCCLDLIYTQNKVFLEQMEARLKKFPQDQTFGDVLVKHAPKPELYSEYINNFDNAVDLHRQLMANPKFKTLHQSCMQAANTRLDLPSLLIQPVQRMPRYQLLIRELLKKTPSEHADRSNLEDAMDKFTEINIFTNKRKKEVDNAKKLNAVKNSVTGLKFDLFANNRLFIRQGILWVEKPAKTYSMVIMFNDICFLTKAAKKDSPPPYEAMEVIEFAKTDFLDSSKDSFKLCETSGAKREWSFQAESEEAKQAWAKDIREALDTFQLRSLLDNNISQGTTTLKEGLIILSATYGVLSSPKKCVDVTQALQTLVNQEGGQSLTIGPGSKATLSGFINPAKGKSKQLMVVFSAKGVVRNKTFGDKDEVKIRIDRPN